MFFITNSKVYKASTSFLFYRLYSVCMQQKDKARNNYTPWLSIMNIKFIVDSLSYRNYSFYFIWVIQFYIKQVVFLPAFIIRKISITLDELGILIIHDVLTWFVIYISNSVDYYLHIILHIPQNIIFLASTPMVKNI